MLFYWIDNQCDTKLDKTLSVFEKDQLYVKFTSCVPGGML